MSFDNIFLPKSVIAEIYKDHLVEIVTKKDKKNLNTSADVTTSLKYLPKFLGKNLKHILILVHYPDVVYLPDDQLESLSKILSACKLDIGDIAIINTANQQANEEEIHLLKARSILVFGECVSNILDDKSMDFFSPVYLDKISIFSAPALEKLFLSNDESKQLKSNFWLSLQQYFKL